MGETHQNNTHPKTTCVSVNHQPQDQSAILAAPSWTTSQEKATGHSSPAPPPPLCCSLGCSFESSHTRLSKLQGAELFAIKSTGWCRGRRLCPCLWHLPLPTQPSPRAPTHHCQHNRKPKRAWRSLGRDAPSCSTVLSRSPYTQLTISTRVNLILSILLSFTTPPETLRDQRSAGPGWQR